MQKKAMIPVQTAHKMQHIRCVQAKFSPITLSTTLYYYIYICTFIIIIIIIRITFKLSGNSVRPAYPGFIVTNTAHDGFSPISNPSNTNLESCMYVHYTCIHT